MIKSKDTATSQNIVDFSVKGIQEKKGADIVIIDLKNIGNAVASFFVVCTGSSDTQLNAIAESIEKEVFKNCHEDPWHKEGYQNKEWILLDYVDVVVHIFKKEVREHYGLEDLWGDAIVKEVEEVKEVKQKVSK